MNGGGATEQAAQRFPRYSPGARVAVFMDFENLVCGAGNGLPGQSEQVPERALAYLCRGFHGNASIRRAYADWANSGFGRYQPALAANGVDLVQIAHGGVAGKNAADIRMAVDAMEVLITHPDVEVFVLVTGDSDYAPLVHRLREFGKHVVGVGTSAASQRLVSVCSEYKFWGTVVAAVEPAARPVASAAFNFADAEALLVRAFEQIGTDQPTASAVKSAMLALDPSFDQADYGCRTFREFLGCLPHRVTTVGHSGADITISLKTRAQKKTAAVKKVATAAKKTAAPAKKATAKKATAKKATTAKKTAAPAKKATAKKATTVPKKTTT